MTKDKLINCLTEANPGWPEWNALLELVVSLDWEPVSIDYLGEFIVSDNRLTFSVPTTIPDFAPSYVAPLYGMKCGSPEMAGGYAEEFQGAFAQRGSLFSPIGKDVSMGYPEFDPPANAYAFQTNSSGAMFYLLPELTVAAPNADRLEFDEIGSLEAFTRHSIACAIAEEDWYQAYARRNSDLLD